MIKAVIFDCFGVVITDALEILRADLIESRPAAAQEVEDIINASNRGFMEPREAISRLAELSGRPADTVRHTLEQGESKDARLLGFIRELRATYKTAMLSNISVEGLARRFSQTELDEHFDVAIASGAIGFAKPEPEAYEVTADRLGVRLQECMMVDDRIVCVDGARATGMQAIHYQDFNQFEQAFNDMTKE